MAGRSDQSKFQILKNFEFLETPMCLAIPALVERISADDGAVVNLGGIRKAISLALVEDIKPGDYVIVHAGYALQKLDLAEAEHTLQLFEAMSAGIGDNED